MNWQILQIVLFNLLLGIFAGFAIGYSLKKISKFVVFIIGIILIIGIFAFLNNSFPNDWSYLSVVRDHFVFDIDFSIIPSIVLSNLLVVLSGVFGFIKGFKAG